MPSTQFTNINTMIDDPIEDEDFDLGPSKTQLKKASLAFQDLGQQLCELNDQKLAKLPLSDTVMAAIQTARGMRANAARKRQIQYIGKLLRNDNGEDIGQALEAMQAEHSHGHQLLQLSEHWSERLIGEPDALAQFLDLHPQADRQQLRALVRNCQKLPPESQQSPAHKKLRKWLRTCITEHGQ